MRRHDVALTLLWRCFKVVCLQGYIKIGADYKVGPDLHITMMVFLEDFFLKKLILKKKSAYDIKVCKTTQHAMY